MRLAAVIALLDGLAPLAMAEEWDNCGLQAGDPQAEIASCLVSLDPTPAAIDEAVAGVHDLLLTHHPLIPTPLHRLQAGEPAADCLRAGLNVVALHTCLDSAPGGLNDIWAGALGLKGTRPLDTVRDGRVKLVAFVPEAALPDVRDAVFAAGAGRIGLYTRCRFETPGSGGFLPGPGAEPAIGERGREESVTEVRLETDVPEESIETVIDAMLTAHPYEEPVYDIYRRENLARDRGLGRVGELPEAIPVAELIAKVKGMVDGPVRHTAIEKEIRRVAVCTGSGSSLVKAALAEKADAFIAGDMRHHDPASALEMLLIDAGHFGTEDFAMRRWTEMVLEPEMARCGVKVMYAESSRSPWSEA